MKVSERKPHRQISLVASPAEIAAQLSHLPGLIFLDSAGNLPSGADRPYSIIAAYPIQELNSAKELQEAESALMISNNQFPSELLAGLVTYEGKYHFGHYDQFLIFDHFTHSWWEIGELSSELRSPSEEQIRIGEIEQETTAADFKGMVQRALDYIRAGDIYQVNLAQKFSSHISAKDIFPLYEELRVISPAPMAAYLAVGGYEILSSSPELFLKVHGRKVITKPIKGTRGRFVDPEQDSQAAAELLTSEKERAELVMITDLLRNDLGRVAKFGTVEVPEMLKLESFQHVHHMVSTVSAILRPDISITEVLQQTLPGGSITGAPKVRATEIIAELEPSPRGPYTGTIGYIGSNSQSQFNLAIRTLVRRGDELSFHVGAGIVADSDPAAEYQETLDKARGIRAALASL